MKKLSLRMDALFDFLLSAFQSSCRDIAKSAAIFEIVLLSINSTCLPITFLRCFVLICEVISHTRRHFLILVLRLNPVPKRNV